MPVLAGTNINLTGLSVPDPYVMIGAPPPVINGVASNLLGIVGIGSWGPLNAPQTVGDPNEAAEKVGDPQNRYYDLASAVQFCNEQGASDFSLVRVSDGTDVAASYDWMDTASTPASQITFTGKYTGSKGNDISVTISSGSQANTYKVVVSMGSQLPETFDNIGGTGAAVFTAMAAAINSGQSGLRGQSNYVVATAGTSTLAPVTGTQTLTGGTDGVTTITGSVLLGSESSRTGLYALIGTGVRVAYLADNSDSTTWATEKAFGDKIGCEMVMVGPEGEYTAIGTAVSNKQTAGIDGYNATILLGDWVYMNDPATGVQRMTSPQHAYAGRRAQLAPHIPVLNLPMAGIIATQASEAGYVYSDDDGGDISQLVAGGLELLTNPCPGGSYFGARCGVNSSTDIAERDDNYGTLTNYIAYSMDQGIGPYIGMLQTPSVQLEAKATLEHFLEMMKGDPQSPSTQMIEGYTVTLGTSNNSQTSQALGYMKALVRVEYFGVIRYFVVDFEGGPTVVLRKAP